MANKEADIIKQLEYYFCDENLKRDIFMKKQMSADEADHGVAVKVLMTFKNLKALTTDAEEVVACATKAASLKVSEDKSKIMRKVALPKHIPLMGGVVTLNGKEYTKKEDVVKALREILHSADEKPLEGDNAKMLKEFVAFHPKAPEKIGAGIENVYVGKNEKYESTKCFCIKRTDGTTDDFSYWKVLENLFPEPKKGKKDKKEQKEGTRRSERIASQSDEPGDKKRKRDDDNRAEKEVVKGLLLKVKNMGEGAAREDLKDLLSTYGKVAYVDMTRGDTEAVVRFDSVEEAKAAVEGAKDKEVKGSKIETSLLEGDEENSYWEKVHQAQADRKKDNKNKKFGNRGGSRHGGGKRAKKN